MTTWHVFRVGAAVLALGGLLALLGVIVIPGQEDPAAVVADPRFLPGHLALLAGSVLILLGLPAAYGRAAERMGVPGLLGFAGVMIAVAAFGVSLSLLTLMILPWTVDVLPEAQVAAGPPAFGIFFPVAGIVATVGAVLFGIAVAMSRVYTPWPGYLLILAGAVQFIMGAVGADLGLPRVVETIADAAYFLTLGWLGVELWARPWEAVHHGS